MMCGMRHGQGTATWSEGKKYVGQWRNDQRHGTGTMTWPGGATYVGEWVDGQPGGRGVQTCPDGKTHVGEFKVSFRHGRGIEYWPDGASATDSPDYWDDGEIISKDEWFRRDKKRSFAALEAKIGIPPGDRHALRFEEKLYVLYLATGDEAILESDGFSSYVMSVTVDMMRSRSRSRVDALLAQEDSTKILSFESEAIEKFCDRSGLVKADRRRLMIWARWCKSSERAGIEAYFRGRRSLES